MKFNYLIKIIKEIIIIIQDYLFSFNHIYSLLLNPLYRSSNIKFLFLLPEII
jgi:hypothetical protein